MFKIVIKGNGGIVAVIDSNVANIQAAFRFAESAARVINEHHPDANATIDKVAKEVRED